MTARPPHASSGSRIGFWGRGLLFSLPALALAALPWINGLIAPPALRVWLAAALLFLYPGCLLLRLLDRRWRLGRAALPTAFVLGYGLWSLPAVALLLFGGSLDDLIAVAVAGTLLLAWIAAWRARPRPLAWPWPWQNWLRDLRRDWWAELLFWGALAVLLALFWTYAGVERFSDRQSYLAQLRSYVTAPDLAAAGYLPYAALGARQQLASWLVQLAAVARLAAVDPAFLYSYALPPLALALSLLAVWGLGRRITRSRRGAGLAAALLALQWVSTIALPQTAGYSYLERVQLRPEGAFATLGYWAVTSHILEDKFILALLMLPVALLLLLRWLEPVTAASPARRARPWGRLALLAVALAGLAFIHPLGAAFFGLVFGALAGLHLLRLLIVRAGPRALRAAAIRLLAVALLLLLAALPAFWQRDSFLAAGGDDSYIAPASAGNFAVTGPAEVGLWVWPARPDLYAVDLFVLWRQPLLLLAVALLPALVLWRRLRSLGDQLLAAMILLVLLAAYTPLLAPLLGRVITYRMLFRVSWLLELPAILLLARLGVLLLASLRLRRPHLIARRPLLAPLLLIAPLALAAILLAPRIAAALTLLADVRAGHVTAAELDALAFLRGQTGEPASPGAERGLLVWAPPDLVDELPAAVGNAYGPYFRWRSLDPSYYAAIRDFYAPAVGGERLRLFAEQAAAHMPAFILAEIGSAVDAQLGELPDAFTPVHRNDAWVVYAPTADALASQPFTDLVAASRALAGRDYAQAERLARQVLTAAPGSLTAQVLLAQSLLAGRQVDAALDAARAAAARAPDSQWASRLLAAAERGAAAWAEADGDTPAAAAAYQAALAADPGDVQSARLLAQSLGPGPNAHAPAPAPARGSAAAAAITALEAAAAPSPQRTTAERSAAYAQLGAAYAALGDLPAAEGAYRAGLDIARPWDLAARGAAVQQLGRFYVDTGRPAAAQELYTAQVGRYPAAPAIYTALADLAQAQLGPEAAAVVYRAAAAANPAAAWPHLAIARLALQGDSAMSTPADTVAPYAVAEAALRQAVALDRSNQEAYRLLADLAQDRAGLPAALRMWEEAAAANPQAAWPLTSLAAAASAQGDYAAAVKALERALALAPADVQAASDLAAAQRALTAVDAAQRWANAAALPPAAAFTPVNGSSADGWTLVGYFADAPALLTGNSTPIWLVWQAPDAAALAGPAAGWQQVDAALWVQGTTAANLVTDGGFARGAGGFPQDYYAAGSAARAVQGVERGGKQTQAAVLTSGPANPSTSFVSPPMAVEGGKVYLQAGALRSAGGRGYLGSNWLLADGGGQEGYLFAGEESGFWQAGSTLVEPPPGAVSVQVFLLNRNATGPVYFDDVLFLALDRPG